MAKNIIMKQLTSSGYEEIYPKTIPSQIEGFSESANAGAFAVGDILLSTRQDLSNDWILCNGAEYNPDTYPNLTKYRPFDYSAATVNQVRTYNHPYNAAALNQNIIARSAIVHNRGIFEIWTGSERQFGYVNIYMSYYRLSDGAVPFKHTISLGEAYGSFYCSACSHNGYLYFSERNNFYYAKIDTPNNISNFSTRTIPDSFRYLYVANNQLFGMTEYAVYRSTSLTSPSFSKVVDFNYDKKPSSIIYNNGIYYIGASKYQRYSDRVDIHYGSNLSSLTAFETPLYMTQNSKVNLNCFNGNIFLFGPNHQGYSSQPVSQDIYKITNNGSSLSATKMLTVTIPSGQDYTNILSKNWRGIAYSEMDGTYFFINNLASETKYSKNLSSFSNIPIDNGWNGGPVEIIQDTANMYIQSGYYYQSILRYPKVPNLSATGAYYYIRGK